MIISRIQWVTAAGLVVVFAGWAQGQTAQGNPDHPAGGDAGTAAPAAAPAQAAPAAGDLSAPHNSTYIIGNDDELGINVWKEQELTQSVPVRSDGKISLPLIGEVTAAGRTPLQLEEDIASKLRSFLTNPQVTVMVLQMNSQKFNILGRVAKPGSYSLSATTTVLDAIAQAGGFLDFAKQKDIYVLREKPGGGETRIAFNYKDVIHGKHSDENIRLQPHDTIVVP
jgi:polysaccharide biosynthesis/export protein